MHPNQRKVRRRSPVGAAPAGGAAGGAAGAALVVDDDDEEVEPVVPETRFTILDFSIIAAWVASILVLIFFKGMGVMLPVIMCVANFGVLRYALSGEYENKSLVIGSSLVFMCVSTFMALMAQVMDCSTCWGPGTVSAESMQNHMRECARIRFLSKKYWGEQSNIFYTRIHDKKAEKTWPACFDNYDAAWNPCVINTNMNAHTTQQLSCRTK